MEKRDLKADLEVVQKAKEFEKVTDWESEEFVRLAPYFSNFHENGIAIAEHAIERAIEAEELSRELLEALKFFFKCLSDKDLVEPEPSHFLSLELSQIATLCHKAEEVLGDE